MSGIVFLDRVHLIDLSFRTHLGALQGYTIPNRPKIQEYHDFINNMPLVDTPGVFGLHPNADIT